MNNNNNVFVKRKDLEKQISSQIYSNYTNKVSLSKIIESIPSDHYNLPQENLRKNMIEWRWRVIQFENKKMIEISSLVPGSQRKYIDKSGELIEYDKPIDSTFDQCVIKEYYYYTF
ncbi:MAG: hypothetical protein Edafosvirus10_17 [Edafosvirus sp.]|uniref:Uncharacterized protein n=1 Tax=Edafosvirus sp. TaxID=2487765 RepID=A0A3G4ZTW3_9VIRU|nr:MAG: hypothetical protein Edafosvirus10_17 [Edafosvirus sp.]